MSHNKRGFHGVKCYYRREAGGTSRLGKARAVLEMNSKLVPGFASRELTMAVTQVDRCLFDRSTGRMGGAAMSPRVSGDVTTEGGWSPEPTVQSMALYSTGPVPAL